MTNTVTPHTAPVQNPEVIVVDNVALLNREALVGMVQTCGEVLGLTDSESGTVRDVQVVDWPTPDAALPPREMRWFFQTATTGRYGTVAYYVRAHPVVEVNLYENNNQVRTNLVVPLERLKRLDEVVQQQPLVAMLLAQEIARDVKTWVDAYVDPRRVVKNDTTREGTTSNGTTPMVTNAPRGVSWNYHVGTDFSETRFTHEPRYACASFLGDANRWSCWCREVNGNERHVHQVTLDEAIAWITAAPRR